MADILAPLKFKPSRNYSLTGPERPRAMRAMWAAFVGPRRRFDASIWRWINLICWRDRFAIEFD